MDDKTLKELSQYKNLSSFQFIDTVNSLLGAKFRKNCEKFSLRDKAHIRNLIKSIDSQRRKQLKKMKSEAKESKALSKEYNQAIQNLQELDKESNTLEQLHKLEEELKSQFESQSTAKQALLAKLQQLKDRHQELVSEKMARENIIRDKYSEAIEMMKGAKATLEEEIDSLSAQKYTNTFGKNINFRAREQELKLKIGQI